MGLVNINAAKKAFLESTDWTQLPDVDLTQEQKDAWKVFRQQIRDMTFGSRWPTPPEKIVMYGPRPEWLDIDSAIELNITNLY
jgi:hypothetical protein